MSLNFRWAAASYLNAYIRFDRECMAVFHRRTSTEEEKGKELVRLAKEYLVIRGFRAAEEPRMQAALNALLRRDRPANKHAAVECVNGLADELQQAYGRRLISAASKFLWMRFQAPVIMYDNLGSSWLQLNGGLARTHGYGDFCTAWRQAYAEHSAGVQEACLELCENKKIREFTLAAQATRPPGFSDQQLEVLFGKCWFRERVFDQAIINDPLR